MTAYRDDVAALAARHQALAAEVAHKTRELDETTRLLDDARARARLPVLDNLRIASPCTADWTQMTGDDRVRACGLCEKDVFNLSELTREEAEALILEKAGNLCARYYQRHDGTILLKDCTVGVAQKRKRRVLAAGALTLLGAGSAAAALYAGTGHRCSGEIPVEAEEEYAPEPPDPWHGEMSPEPAHQPGPGEDLRSRPEPRPGVRMGDISFAPPDEARPDRAG